MSNYTGYDQEDNSKRKSNNIETGQEFAKTMCRTKRYGGNGPGAASKEANECRKLSKNSPVKVYTKKEIEEFNRRAA